MTTLAEHLARLDAENVLLVEIDAAGSSIYLADTAYITEPGDTPANQPYAPIIAQDGVPRMSRRIQEVWGGRSVPAWGPLVLATPSAGGTDLATANLRGKTVQVLLTGPRRIIARFAAAVVLTGVLGRRSGDLDGALTLEITDFQASFDERQLPVNQYDGTESGSFPQSEIGRSVPLCLGTCRNVTPRLIDTANRTYQVNDGPVHRHRQSHLPGERRAGAGSGWGL